MKAVVFDMDGVLFDTERLCKDCWCETAREHNLAGMEEVFPKCIGTNNNDTIRIVLDFYGEDFPYEAFAKEADGKFHDYLYTKGVPEKPGIREILSFLKQKGYLIGLASSSKRASIERNLNMAGILDYFDNITSGDMVEHSKPNPEIYEIACRELGVEPAEAYAIEDSYNGIRSAYAAGMKAIMVPDLIAPDAEMQEKAITIQNSLFEVITYLDLGEQ